ncbi:pyroglutamyl-peptidase I [soil metagenome]
MTLFDKPERSIVLVTGFEPYGGLRQNPSHDVMERLDGETLEGLTIVGCSLPVSISELNETVGDLLLEHRPAAVLSLGLSPGESAIRIERLGLNLADFPIPDNTGERLRDEPLSGNGPAARWTTWPARKIERALLAAGIPARLSVSAGTYLCNACIYTFMEMLEETGESVPYGFLHVPLAPAMVAHRLLTAEDDLASLPSMDVAMIAEAARIALREMLTAPAAPGMNAAI